MGGDEEIEQWLAEQPLDSMVVVGDDSVYLNIHPGGAELGAILVDSFTLEQMFEALRQGFSSALGYDAGLGISEGGGDLVLSQWLPGVSGWREALEPLENLLMQLSVWREELKFPASIKANDAEAETAQLLRSRFLRK